MNCAYSSTLHPTTTLRNIDVAGQKTAIRLETSMWEALDEISLREHKSVPILCASVNKKRGTSTLNVALRAYIVSYFRDAARSSRYFGGMGETGHRSFLFNSALAACA